MVVVDKMSGLRSVASFGPNDYLKNRYEELKLAGASETELAAEFGDRTSRRERFINAVRKCTFLPEKVLSRAEHLPRTKERFLKYCSSRPGGNMSLEATEEAWLLIKQYILEAENQEGLEESDSVVGRLQKAIPAARPVHRLDMQTSGLLAVALNAKAAADLSEQWRSRTVEKGYLALVHGNPSPRDGIIDLPLERILTPRYDKDVPRMVVAPGGKRSVTSYRVLSESSASFSLVALTPHTGRMHQLRAHLDAIGHSILGDEVYGSPKIDFKPSRLCLHAAYLSCTDPDSSERWSVSSPDPDFLQEAVKYYPPFSQDVTSFLSTSDLSSFFAGAALPPDLIVSTSGAGSDAADVEDDTAIRSRVVIEKKKEEGSRTAHPKTHQFINNKNN